MTMRSVRWVGLGGVGLILAYAGATPIARGQGFGGCSPVDQGAVIAIPQFAIDDLAGTNPAQPKIQLSAMRGLGVKAADFDRNGYLDLVIGGQMHGTVPASEQGWVKVFYMYNAGSHIDRLSTEVIDNSSAPPQPPLFLNTSNCYGVDVGDFNEDGWVDICVGRRNGAGMANQEFDTVWLNNRNPIAGANRFESGSVDGISNPQPLNVPNVLAQEPWILALLPHLPNPSIPPVSETFAIDVANVNGLDGSPARRHLDIITCGHYGIRYFRGKGDGTFEYMHSLIEGTALAPSSGVYRNITFGDVNADGLVDMVVTRDGQTMGPTSQTASDRVWFNQFPGPANPQFALSPPGGSIPAPLVRPPRLVYQWRTTSGSSLGQHSGECLVGDSYRSIDSALGDLDGDGDLDLSVALANARNAIYLNDGLGRFGSANSGSCSGNGYYTYAFNSPTSDWPSDSPAHFASSEMLFDFCDRDLSAYFGVPEHSLDWNDFEFHIDGKVIDTTSSTRIADFNQDGLNDVAFANRNEPEEVALFAYTLVNPNRTIPYPYLSTNPNHPAPDSYDHVYFRIDVGETKAFSPCVEQVGFANDGTSYTEIVRFGGDGGLDWIESNYNNQQYLDLFGAPLSGVSPNKNTWVFFGQSLPYVFPQIQGCTTVTQGPNPPQGP